MKYLKLDHHVLYSRLILHSGHILYPALVRPYNEKVCPQPAKAVFPLYSASAIDPLDTAAVEACFFVLQLYPMFECSRKILK
jgi:hypothetical protein